MRAGVCTCLSRGAYQVKIVSRLAQIARARKEFRMLLVCIARGVFAAVQPEIIKTLAEQRHTGNYLFCARVVWRRNRQRAPLPPILQEFWHKRMPFLLLFRSGKLRFRYVVLVFINKFYL
jgi:hypothetical protein